MSSSRRISDYLARNNFWLPLTALLLLPAQAPAAGRSGSPQIVAQWGRFEVTLTSTFKYSNPVQDASLSAEFISPQGETNRVFGFWDGGKTWRVRFAPNTVGRWTFTTACSDTANAGLENQSGAFICTARLNKTPLEWYGPVRVARGQRHFEHANGRPFLWLGDVASEGARRSSLEDWQLYTDMRAEQRFTAAHWTVAPGQDAKGETAFTTANGFAINVSFFQRLDEKVEMLNRAGLLSAIVPLQEFGPVESALSDGQAELFVRYVVARWGANHVAWLLAFEGDSSRQRVERWKRIGRAVFGNRAHAPVVLLPGETHWLLEEFRKEAWVDAFGFPTTTTSEDGLQWMFVGPWSAEWRKSPPRPILNLSAPAESSPSGDDTRRLLWWNLLMAPTAGASYAAGPVMNWMTSATTNPNVRPRDLPQWREALFLPGVKNVAIIAEFFKTNDFWRLRPAQEVVPNPPGERSPRRHVAVARTEARDLAVVYVPEDRTVEVLIPEMPPSPTISWINPRTGQRSTAVGLVGGYTCQFPTPEPGDWLLVLKTRK